MPLLSLILAGLLVGLVGGTFGVGGGIILIPALTEVLGPNQHLYQSTAMIVNFFVAVPAVFQHHRAKAIEPRIVLAVVPLAVSAVVLGVAVSEWRVFAGTGEAYLRALFGLFLLACGAYDVYRLLRRSRPTTDESVTSSASSPNWRSLAWVAIPTGFASGLLGVGGGILAVPLQRRFLRTPLRTAIANSAAIIVATSVAGALVKNYAFISDDTAHGHPLRLAAVLIPTAIAGSLIGARLTHRLPVAIVKGGFVVVLLVSAVRLLQSAANSIQ